ncbi:MULTISPECIES: CHRD domain-containing protein [Bradyrhizobium]|uniref:CHRD domain-containing protein n=2 Tax=Bradyrhizobium TaxID=374 RepID=A0ABY0Q9Q4_9BRAD|nr:MULTISPECIES: CHRD domain-containing protein [Bradyrhizobium]SDJ74034.1 CHRD domain-containing protein [Bradyrhizobium ottawaense]SEC18829.1 CHRD domain-containing protein [Bradyrhizobium lablabi]
MSNKTMLATLALGAAIAFSGTAFAEKMKATLDGKAEVPPNASAGSGTADIDYDPATKKLSWKLTYTGLSGPATAAHFHGPAEAGKNAGVAVAIPNAASSPAEGSATLTDAQAADLTSGKYYVNVHTAANPGGEIRGQVMK